MTEQATTDVEALARRIIADARRNWGNADPDSVEENRGGDSFDHHVAVEWSAYGQLAEELHNASDVIANESHPITAGAGQAALDANRERARRQWTLVEPHVKAYAADCKNAEYTGWSKASRRPVRRVR